jgi:two-component system sensor histidine kinase/response regulator
MDGFGLAEQIKRRPELKTSIMMLTSGGQSNDATRCRELGISAYMFKPIKQSELLDSILKIFGRKDSIHELGKTAAPSRDQTSFAAVRGLRVLLAEDNMVNQRLAARLLEKKGHTAVVVGDGVEAVEAVRKEKFDLVLMDVQMPVMGGFEATAAIREWERTTGLHTPIVAMTAHAMTGDRERCMEAGMDDYIPKPIQPKQLYEVIERMISTPIEIAKENVLAEC